MQIARHPKAGAGLAERLWIYQAERFPLFKTGLLLLVFSAASISISAHLGGRPLPGWPVFASVWAVTFILFFQMRACDEWKDLEDDRTYRPERPIPSGLISLRFVIITAIAAAGLALLLAGNIYPLLLLPLALVWVWLALMTAEFFAPKWLKARPLIYLVTHMAIMPLIDLFITAAEWLPHGNSPPAGLWLFLALSFTNGCVLEIGRKIWAPDSEREGVETYSGLWGAKRAAYIWCGICAAAWLLLSALGWAVGAPLLISGLGFIALAIATITALRFIRAPSRAGEKAIENIAGLWVFICYAVAGFAPALANWVAA
ncbi:UbiA family prenyltransferase [Sphingorhabdus arenilitoris]|uniref:UbiA family prenyltransferase n=1 Tax=Sphingorhabdus arenilitoris TaxID=1490041 RepID=A0ABV8RIM6_9SPHN